MIGRTESVISSFYSLLLGLTLTNCRCRNNRLVENWAQIQASEVGGKLSEARNYLQFESSVCKYQRLKEICRRRRITSRLTAGLEFKYRRLKEICGRREITSWQRARLKFKFGGWRKSVGDRELPVYGELDSNTSIGG